MIFKLDGMSPPTKSRINRALTFVVAIQRSAQLEKSPFSINDQLRFSLFLSTGLLKLFI